MAEEITRFIDLQIEKSSPSVAAAGFGILLLATNSAALTRGRRVETFTTVAEVEDFFGTTSQEAYAADAFFNQDPFLDNQPEDLYFGKIALADEGALLETGDSTEQDVDVWTPVTDGTFEFTTNAGTYSATGCDFSAAITMEDVATVLQTQAVAAGFAGTITYQDSRFVIATTATGAGTTISLTSAEGTGTDVSGATTTTSNYMDGAVLKSVSVPGGAIITNGFTVGDETAEDSIAAMELVNNDWYGMGITQPFRGDAILEDIADAIEGRRKMFFVFDDAAGYLTGSTSTLAYYCNNLNYKRTVVIYYDDNSAADENVRYPDISWIGQQFPKNVGQTNWSYKKLAGTAQGARVNILPLPLNETQINNIVNIYANTYTTTLGANFMYFGTACGGRNANKEGEYIDIVRNIDFLQARLEEGLLSLLLERDIIPYTDGGISLTDNRLRSLLDTYGVKQGILVDGTVETSFPTRAQTSSADRDDRLLPSGTFTAELTGGINKVVIRGTVYI